MALSILDGNQSATTLSTILSSGQHITAHTVVSLGTQAITDMRGAVSGSVVSISNFPATQTIAGTVTANVGIASEADVTQFGEWVANGFNAVQPTISVIGSSSGQPFPISGTVTANVFGFSISENAPKNLLTDPDGVLYITPNAGFLSIGGTVTANLGSALPTGTNRIGVVTIGAGTVTIGAGTAQIGSVTASISGTVPVSGTFFQATQPVSLTTLPALVAGTAQIGSVTASISGTVPISISSVTVGNSVTIASLPALVAGTAQIGSVTASISNSVVTFYPLQGTAVSNTNFTSTTASTTLVSAVAGREVLTVFSEGPGNLFISSGATCTTISYQVRLSSGDYWECPQGQLSLAHSAVFATAGTARVTEVS